MGQETVDRQPSHAANQAVGLLVFAGGIVLLGLVFYWAWGLYEGLDQGLVEVRPAQNLPPVEGVGPAKPAPPGTVAAEPQNGTPWWHGTVILVAKLLVLLGMGWIGGLIASKGIRLALGPSRIVHAPPREG